MTVFIMYRVPVILLCICHLVSSAAEKTVITYNTALYQGIDLFGDVSNPPRREDRRDAIISELTQTENDADLVCLQEVFIGEDVNAIIRGVESVYPHSFSDLHDNSGNIPLDGEDTTPPCGNGFLQGLYFSLFMRCGASYCGNIQSAEEAVTCISSHCLLQYAMLSQECLICLSSSGPILEEIREKCSRRLTYSPMRYRNINTPGLLLLSKTNIHSASFVDYHPYSKEYTGRYGYLQGQVDDLGQVICTHVTANLGDTYLEPGILVQEWITSYEEQTTAEIIQLVSAFSDAAPVILLGDFNVGDAVSENITACSLDNYKILTSAFQTQSHDQCTFCSAPENAYNGDTPSRVIDHIFYKGFSYKHESSTRVFDGMIVEGYPMSDHFGVKQSLRLTAGDLK